MRARQGAAGIRMASHTVAANAFIRHDESKAAAHGQPEPPPMASFEPSGLGTAALLRPVPKSELLRNLESKFTVPECFALLLSAASIDSPAARSALGKI